LKAGITRAIFHVDGNMPFCNEKLKIIAKGIQMVSEVLLKLMKGTSQNYSIPPLYDNDSNELIYDDKIKANLLNKYFCSISYGHA
jgi:hypothetical protein